MGRQKAFEIVHIAQGELEANVIKSHLESEGIPVLLEYESVGRIIGLTIDGLGEIKVLVPRQLTEVAKKIIEPENTESCETDE